MSEYWKSRKLDNIFENNVDLMLKKLKKIYKEQAKEIEKAITEIYVKMLEDGEISNTNLYKLNRYNDLALEINKILKSYGEKEVKTITKGLEVATKELIGDIHKNSTISFVMLNENQIQEIVNTSFKGKNFSKRIWANRENLSKSIQKNIQNIVAIGMNKDSAIKEIIDIHNSSFFNADRLVRTETMRCLNSGTLETYKARGRTHGYYIYALDRRTCPNCIDIAERTKASPLPLDELEPVHHPNCRCTILPVVDIDNLKNDEKDDIINKKLYPNKIANVKRGNNMTRDEANHGKPNPNYNKGKGYDINCQTCVVAFEARLRGYNVEALPNYRNSKINELSYHTNRAWIDSKTGTYPTYIKDDKINSPKKAYDFINKVVDEGGRYTIEFAWKGRNAGGHIISLDRTEEGEIRFYDPQIGEEYIGEKIIKKYLSNIKFLQKIPYTNSKFQTMKILRIDDREFNLEMVDNILRGVD